MTIPSLLTFTGQETDCSLGDMKAPCDNQGIAGGPGITLLCILEVCTLRENVMGTILRFDATEGKSPKEPNTFQVLRKGGCRHLGPPSKHSVKPRWSTSLGTAAASHKKRSVGALASITNHFCQCHNAAAPGEAPHTSAKLKGFGGLRTNK